MHVCMRVLAYVCKHVCIFVCMYAFMYLCIYICVFVWILCRPINGCLYTYVYITYVCVYVSTVCYSILCISTYLPTWWLIGRFGVFRLKGRRFDIYIYIYIYIYITHSFRTQVHSYLGTLLPYPSISTVTCAQVARFIGLG